MRIYSDIVDYRFLALLGSSSIVRRQIERFFVSTAGQKTVNQGHLSSVLMPLPPRREQGRIVAAIEEQFSRLDAGVAALGRVRRNLRRLRDLLPLLMLASIGSAVDHAGVEDIPVDDGPHRWVTLAEVSQQVVDCEHWTPTYLPEGMPCIDTTCISPGVIHQDRLRYVDPATHQSRVRRLAPRHGDLIFAREGTVGTAVVVPKDMYPCLGQRVMLFRPDPEIVDSNYLCFVVNSQIVKRQYRPMLLGTTVPHLNVRDAKALRIPLPTLPVQRAIATEADRIGSVFTAVEGAVEFNVTRSSSLQSSILAAAFSGQLVSQDPTDESASDLLKRVTAERASSNGRKSMLARRRRVPGEKVT
jgi:type I restriction enzyme S subunit